jgi:hypothetical protein
MRVFDFSGKSNFDKNTTRAFPCLMPGRAPVVFLL